MANVVRHNNGEFEEYERDENGRLADRLAYITIVKLTAILRLANAMDRSHSQKVEGLRAVLKDRELHMVIDASQDVSLELGLLKEKVEFFEKIFGIRLVLRRKKKA